MKAKIIELNLLPFEYKERLVPASKKLGLDIPRFIPISLGGLLSFLILSSALAFLHGSAAKHRLGEQKHKLKKVRALAVEARGLDKKLPKLRECDQYLTTNVGKKLKCWNVLEQISKSCPEGVKIADIRISNIGQSNLRLAIMGSYKKGEYLEGEFRINLENSRPLREYFTKFVAEREVGSGSESEIKFTIIGASK